MAQSSKKLPRNILERPDSEAVGMLLGKRVKKGLDKEAQAFEAQPNTKLMSQRYTDSKLASSE